MSAPSTTLSVLAILGAAWLDANQASVEIGAPTKKKFQLSRDEVKANLIHLFKYNESRDPKTASAAEANAEVMLLKHDAKTLFEGADDDMLRLGRQVKMAQNAGSFPDQKIRNIVIWFGGDGILPITREIKPSVKEKLEGLCRFNGVDNPRNTTQRWMMTKQSSATRRSVKNALEVALSEDFDLEQATMIAKAFKLKIRYWELSNRYTISFA